MNPNQNKAPLTVHFNGLKMEQLRINLQDVGFFFLDFGIWAFDDQVLKDLIECNSLKYFTEFTDKLRSETHGEWYDTFGRGEVTELDVLEFFAQFQKDYQEAITSGLFQQFRVITGEDEKGYYYFEVLPPAWITN